MGPKQFIAAILGATLVAWSGMSMADQYRPDEFLGLDLSTAVLSPKPLGPSTQFAPVRIEARTESARPAAATRATPAKTQIAQRVNKPWGAARATLARRSGNPLDAQASDTRVQSWPCKSGGICNWK